jgi:caffeoyl-CoA O-methyltransferase
MSETSTTVGAEHFAYIASHTLPEPPVLKELKRAAGREEIPSIWIAPEQAAFLRVLFRACRVREVIEVGTLAGYSAMAMALALPAGGKVRTIEKAPKRAAFARSWIDRAGMTDRIELFEGDATEILPTFPAGSADALFLDADKGHYPQYLREGLRILRKRGLVLADNAFAFGQLLDEHPTDPEVPAMRAFNEAMARCPELESVIVPLGDGLWMGVKR